MPGDAHPQPKASDFTAIWDTGATASVITQAVVDACGLQPTGMVQVRGVHGVAQSETFLVNIYLPNLVVFPGLRVTRGELAGADILIGMDVINRGDFAVTNLGGRTMFSFRYPSLAHIDFVDEHNKTQARSASQARRSNLASGSKRRRK